MKTLFVCFLIKIAGILCYVQEVKYPYSEILKPDIMYNLTNKNISNKIPEVIAKYIISRKNNTTLSENPDSIINSINVNKISSTDNVNKIKMIEPMPYKYIEVIHYVPIKVTTSKDGEKVILDTNSSIDNMQKVIVHEDGLSNLQNIIVNNDDLDKVQNTIVSEESLKNIDLDNMLKVTVSNNSGRRNMQNLVIYKDNVGQSDMRKTIINNLNNIDKRALLNSLSVFIRHRPKGDNDKSQIIFKLLLRNFINYLVDRGISSLEILEYLRRQREVTDKGVEVLFTDENQNGTDDYTKVIHFNDNMHNNLKNEGIMKAIEKQALLNSYNYFAHNPPEGDDLFAFKNKEIYVLILRDFVKYLIQNGITDLEIMEYLQRAQRVGTREGTKETSQQSMNNNQELDLNTNDQFRKDVTLNEHLNTNESVVLQENQERYEVFNNDSTISIENPYDSSNEPQSKSNLSNYINIPETSDAPADTSKSEDSHIVNRNSYRTSKEDNKRGQMKNIVENLHENMRLDHNTTPNRVMTSTTNFPIIQNEGKDHDNKSNISIERDTEEIKNGKVERLNLIKGTDDVNTDIIKDIVDQNKTNISTLLRSLSDLNMSNDNLVTKNETIKNKNLSLEVSAMLNEDPENHKTLIVPYTTKSILSIQTEKPNNLGTVHKYKLNKNEDIKMKDNIDLIDSWTSEKPNLTSIFYIDSPKLNSVDTNTDNKKNKDKDIHILKDNIDFIDLWTSEKPNLTSIFHIESPKLNSVSANTDNKENKDKDIHILKDNIDFIDLWTSEKPKLKNIFDIKSPKLNNVDINNDGDMKIKKLTYNSDYVNKIEPPRDTIINEVIKLREILYELVVVFKLLLKEFNPNIRSYNNIINELLKNELGNSHKINKNPNLDIETNEILLENLKILNIILPLSTHSSCNWNKDMDVQKIISKYVQLNNLNDTSFTKNNLNEKILFLIKLLQFKALSQEQMTRIIKFLVINPISPVTNNTVRTYNDIFLNNFIHNLQLAIYKSLLSIVF